MPADPRRPHARATLRRLMALVAVAALMAGGWEGWKRQRAIAELGKDYRLKAGYYHGLATLSLGEAADAATMAKEKAEAAARGQPDPWPGWTPAELERSAAGNREAGAYYQGLAGKYREAEHRPWLPVDPDPPPPW